MPTLVVCNGADEICTPGYARELFDAVGHDDKTFVEIEGANHYYLGRDQIEKVRASAAICVQWLARARTGIVVLEPGPTGAMR